MFIKIFKHCLHEFMKSVFLIFGEKHPKSKHCAWVRKITRFVITKILKSSSLQWFKALSSKKLLSNHSNFICKKLVRMKNHDKLAIRQ